MRSARTTDPTAAVSYVRMSTEDQTLSPRAQRDAIERYARAQGLRLVAQHADLGVSGATPLDERPGLLAALDALRTQGAGVLVVAKRDRLARDVIVAAMIERLVASAGARLDSADGSGNGDGPEAEMMRGVLSVFAQYERKLIHARTRAALATKKRRGERTGEIPLGWALADDGVRLQRHDDEAAAIALAVDLRRAGCSLREIAAELARVGHVPRGTQWHAQTVARLIEHGEAMASEPASVASDECIHTEGSFVAVTGPTKHARQTPIARFRCDPSGLRISSKHIT